MRLPSTTLVVLLAGLLLCAPTLPGAVQKKPRQSSSVVKGASAKKSVAKGAAKKTVGKRGSSSKSRATATSASRSSKTAKSGKALKQSTTRKGARNKPALSTGARSRSTRETGHSASASSRSRTKNAARRPSTRASSAKASRGRATDAALPRGASVRLKQEELERIRGEIREYERRLKESSRAERNTLERIDMYDRQTSLIRTMLSHLRSRIAEHQEEIGTAQVRLERAADELSRLRATYARSLVNAYKRGRMHDTELLLSSTSLNQMFIRTRYLRAFSTRQKREAARVRETQDAVARQKAALEEKLQEQKQTVAEKKTEERTLQKKVVEHQDLLGQVRRDKEAYQAELRRKQAAASKIERLIADLIERERMKRLAASNRKSGAVADADKSAGTRAARTRITELPGRPMSETAFGRLKGRLPWPVAKGAVVGRFGEQVNPKLGTVTISNGIDIEVEQGAAVRAVADGVVSMTYFIAGYGNLVIINHDDGFFTVYAHLSDIGVREGARVKAGQTIARSAETLSGSQVHFELWRERAKQNPLGWLAGR